MTDPTNPQQPNPQQPNRQQPNPQQPGSYQGNLYQSSPPTLVAVRPPLLPRQKSGARQAGIIGFLLLSLGFAMLWIPLILLAIAAVISLVFSLIARTGGGDAGFEQFVDSLAELNLTAWAIPLVAIAIIGALLMAVALFVSARILRSHGISKAWPVTWAAAGVAVVASWIVSGVLSVPLQIVGVGVDDNSAQVLPLRIGIAAMGLLVSIAVSAAIGWLSWWWMAHVMRAPAATTPQ